ncbi:hypothetical protein LOTGIDRAFT_171169 [Lottia gigantea]|uniref:Uncharacterized protein n=1 Tax=Lottia gigantea TaxID=225164 RepID=V4B0N9_LOTGI|nr:hypothetical protein LOTGIDRAFT_171169 [Lottia gigantea]ESP03743.1 hypothetical protein LOTGIDRAFT_171169 [Lottia gigantea]
MATEKSERQQVESIIKERGTVALYIAAFRGLVDLSSCLLMTGVSPNGRTPFGRSALYAATCRDNDAILDLLHQSGAVMEVKDARGETPLLLARRIAAKLCFRKLRLWSLDKNGLRLSKPLNGMVKNINVNLPVNRKLRVKFQQDEPLTYMPRPPTSLEGSRKDMIKSERSREAKVGSDKTRATEKGTEKRQQEKSPPVDASSQKLPTSNTRPMTSHIPERPSSQCFVWDIDDRTNRNVGAEIRIPSVQPEPRSKSAKHAVRWRDESLVEIHMNPKSDSIKPSYPTTILKNKAQMENFEKRGNLIRTLSKESLDSNSSTLKSDNQSQPDSELTLVSAPGEGSRMNMSDCRSVESAPATSGINNRNKLGSAKTHRHKGGVRLLPFRRKENENDRATTAKRQIRLSEKQKRKERLVNAETFEQWLERKRMQECRERLISQSDESSHDGDSDGGNSAAYDEWMKKRGNHQLHAQHHMTVRELYKLKDRPVRGIVTVGEAQIADTIKTPESPDKNMRCYQQWKGKRSEPKKHVDPELLKARLERKRQQLLAAAVTYEDWLETAEQKKLLMKQILKADMKELERIEEENLKKRSPRQISFDKWNSGLLKRELTEKQRKEREKREVEVLKEEQLRSSLCVTHDVWLERKRQATKVKQKTSMGPTSPRTQAERDKAFASWVRQKQLHEASEVDVNQGRALLNELRNKRQELSAPSS